VVSEQELQEIFPHPSVREVAFELRFAPRLRIAPEVWRIQDKLAESYPTVSQEVQLQPDARALQSYVFANPEEKRTVKVSQENFAVVFNNYGSFEEFKDEALRRAEYFAGQFDIKTFQRVGLRYVNHIQLTPDQGVQDLQRYVNLPIAFDRFDPASIEQLLTEFRLSAGEQKITIRGALFRLPGTAGGLFILDLDCYTLTPVELGSLSLLMDDFHHKIQIQFLEHIREEYKQVMRGNA
jgi:uncharacterized protein (TIGR04255 family)